jgi:hypothetical protein
MVCKRASAATDAITPELNLGNLVALQQSDAARSKLTRGRLKAPSLY